MNAPNDLSPQAIFGDPLCGNSPVRYIYVDEAGTSRQEPVTVVAAVIIQPDDQWKALDDALRTLVKNHVPESLRTNFVIHGKEIFSGGKHIKRDAWEFEKRIQFLEMVLALVPATGIPVALAACPRNLDRSELFKRIPEMEKIPSEILDHILTFVYCITTADRYLRKYTNPSEVATVVAENITKKERLLKAAVQAFRENKLIDIDRYGTEYKVHVTKIIDCIHFAGKAEAPFLQLADVIAFAMRRYFSGEKHGDRLVAALGSEFSSERLSRWIKGHPSTGFFLSGIDLSETLSLSFSKEQVS